MAIGSKTLLASIRDMLSNSAADAAEAADASDVAHFDRESYIAGYQDALVDLDEALALIPLKELT